MQSNLVGQAIEAAITANLNMRALLKDALTGDYGIPLSRAVRDYNTVVVGTGQRSGKTHAMFQLLREGHAVLYANNERARDARSAFLRMHAITDTKVIFTTLEGLAAYETEPTTLWIDDIELSWRSMVDTSIYDKVITNPKQTVVKLV
jgi:hypothetical protein